MYFCGRAFHKMGDILVNIGRKTIREFDYSKHIKKAIASAHYDMVTAPDESYYKDQYWYWIKKHLDSSRLPKKGRYLALGCGQGRLSLPLTRWCSPEGNVLGIDISKEALSEAVKHAEKENISNIIYQEADILPFLKKQQSNSYDGALFIEVIFFLPAYKEALAEIYRVLKPGAILFLSFRPRYFSALHALERGSWSDIDTILEKRSGQLSGSDVCFTWQRSNEIEGILSDAGSFEILTIAGIGCCSGIPGDPHEFICRPSLLSQKEKEKLMKLELAVAESVPDAGRYIFCAAKKIK